MRAHDSSATRRPAALRHVALLRAVNVGGNSLVKMADLKTCLAEAGYEAVTTFIASGNVLFDHPKHDTTRIATRIEKALRERFDMQIPVLVKTGDEIRAIADAIPRGWTNDADRRTNVLYLWKDVDAPDVVERIAVQPEVDEVRYVPGALLWSVDRSRQSRSKVAKIAGTELYRRMTIRNANTARKLAELVGGKTR